MQFPLFASQEEALEAAELREVSNK